MAVITRIIPPEEDGAAVRHILRAKLHFSSHAVSRLAHGGECIFVNGVPVHTPYVLRPGPPPSRGTGPCRWPGRTSTCLS